MNHADIKRHLADYLEGELPIDQRALVDAHLDACDSCAGEVDEMLQTEMIKDTTEIILSAINEGVDINVIINNRAGGNAPWIAKRIARDFVYLQNSGNFHKK